MSRAYKTLAEIRSLELEPERCRATMKTKRFNTELERRYGSNFLETCAGHFPQEVLGEFLELTSHTYQPFRIGLQRASIEVMTDWYYRLRFSQRDSIEATRFRENITIFMYHLPLDIIQDFWNNSCAIVRCTVARRLGEDNRTEFLKKMINDSDTSVRKQVAKGLPLEDKVLMAKDECSSVRGIIAKDIPEEHLHLFEGDNEYAVVESLIPRLSVEGLRKLDPQNRELLLRILKRLPNEELIHYIKYNVDCEPIMRYLSENLPPHQLPELIPLTRYYLCQEIIAKRLRIKDLHLLEHSNHDETRRIILERKESEEYRSKYGMLGLLYEVKFLNKFNVEMSKMVCYQCMAEDQRNGIVFHSVVLVDTGRLVMDNKNTIIKEKFECVDCTDSMKSITDKLLGEPPEMPDLKAS